MGLILPQKIEIRWVGNTRKHYESKGYSYTNNLDEFLVDVTDLTKGSAVNVKVKCDFCNKKKFMPYKDYLKLRSDNYCCESCLKHKKKTKDKEGKLIFVDIPYRNKEWLENEYIIKDREAKDISDECGINLRTLREWLLTFELNKYGKLKEVLDKQILHDLYFIKHLTSEEIGVKYNVTGNTILSLLREYGFKIPSRSELLSIYYEEKDGYEKVRLSQSTLDNRIKSSCRQRGIVIEDFKGFSTDDQHMARNNTYYKEWLRNVFKRDNYTCQCCGKHGGNLNAHHLYNFSEYKNLRYDVKNGITFCEECHLINYPKSFHATYGERNNTPEQVYEFIENYKKRAD